MQSKVRLLNLIFFLLMNLVNFIDLGVLFSNLIENKLLHFLKPTKLVLHLGHLGYSQRSAFLFSKRKIGQIIKKTIRVVKFIF